MAFAARVGDKTAHPGTVSGPGVATVLIGSMPAAVAGDQHACTMPPNAGPHPPSPFTTGSTTVTIGGRAALRVGDKAGCGAAIIAGSANVSIG